VATLTGAPGLGFLVGFAVGLTGIGSGSLMTPLLILAFGLRPAVAVQTALSVAALTKLAGAWAHLRQGTADLRMVTRLASGSVPATLLAGAALTALSARGPLLDLWLERAIAGGLVLTAASVLWRAGRVSGEGGGREAPGAWWVAAGAGAGIAATLTSIGAGPIVAAALGAASRLSAAEVVGTNVVHGALVAFLAAGVHALGTLPDLRLIGLLGLGAATGAMLGSRASAWLPDRVVRSALAVTLIAVSWRWL
jgi:uncharacterized membrane protein YfcA